jgi:hypothetical protein
MKTYVNLWFMIFMMYEFFADFFLEWEMPQTEVVEKIKTLFPKIVPFMR